MRPDRLARLHGAVDRQAGERIRIVPYAGGGYLVGTADAARPAATIVATVAEVPKTIHVSGNGANTGHNADLRSASHTVLFTTSALSYALEQGDRVQLLEQAGVLLVVNSADPFGTNRTLVRLEPLPAGVE